MFEGISGLDLTNNFYRSIVNGNSLALPLDDHKRNNRDPLDPDGDYRFNSYGFRGPEFVKAADLVTIGCSFTYGLGIPEEAIWSNLVASDLGLTHNNIAKPGASIGWIVEKIFNYFAEFGHPKYLLCFFPDAKRFIVPVDGQILTKDHSKKTINYGEPGSLGLDGQFLYNEVAKSQSEMVSVRFLKRPYNVRDIYTPEFGYYSSIRNIRTLEQYCNAVGIKFLWSTWDFELSYHMRAINSDPELKFNNYFSIDTFFYRKVENDVYKDAIFDVDLSSTSDIDRYLDCIGDHAETKCSCYQECHFELMDKYGESNFNIGTDLNYGECCSHPGCHLHQHYANKFAERLKEIL